MISSYDPDGNILSLQRYGSNNNLFDNYNYAYYAGTNRLRRVAGSTDLFTYDYNGNMTNDYMNNNTGIKYDHRNLITEITNQNLNQDPPRTYITRYRYDEAGNRTRKTVFLSEEYDPPPLPEETEDLPAGWTIIVDDYYSRDVSGKEIGVYSSYTLQYWNVWSGNEITGRINYENNSRYYYLKDHLGSVRAVIDEDKKVITAQDYDAWGYYLENRMYEPYTTKNKFTGKERDRETSYDYFGARYYDSRVGRWGATDPLFEKHIQWTPYNYVLGNPLKLIDPDGRQAIVIFGGFGSFSNGGEITEYLYNPKTGTDLIAAKVNNFLINNKDVFTNAELKEYSTSWTGSEVAEAEKFIENHMKDYPDDKIIIYGYSMGGVRANDLAESLNGKYNVSVEFTVDAYSFPENAGRYYGLEIPENVKINYNFYQETVSPSTGARGGKNWAKTENTSVRNFPPIKNTTHQDIDEKTNDVIYKFIKAHLLIKE